MIVLRGRKFRRFIVRICRIVAYELIVFGVAVVLLLSLFAVVSRYEYCGERGYQGDDDSHSSTDMEESFFFYFKWERIS